MEYNLKWRRHGLWKTIRITGHRYDVAQDKLMLFLKDGGLREIIKWKQCELQLGPDWREVQNWYDEQALKVTN